MLMKREQCEHQMRWLGTVENHGKKLQRTRQTFMKIAKITADTASNHWAQRSLHSLKNLTSSIDGHHYVQCKVFIGKILFCRALKLVFLRRRHAHILSQQVTKHKNFVSRGKKNFLRV